MRLVKLFHFQNNFCNFLSNLNLNTIVIFLHSHLLFVPVSMDAKSQFAASDHAKIYRSYRRDTPVSLIEKAVSYLKEKVKV